MSERITLVPAAPLDAPTILAYRNDPAMVAASLSGKRRGQAWFDDVEPHAYLVVRRLPPQLSAPVGYVLLEPTIKVSIMVTEACRGEGVGTAALQQALARCRGKGMIAVEAIVRRDNGASLRAFEKAGFQEQDLKGHVVLAVRL